MENHKKPWFLIFIIFIIFVGAGFLIFVYFKIQPATKKITTKIKTPLTSYRQSDLDLAKKNLEWLEKQTDSQGFFLEKSCDEKTCNQNITVEGGNRDALIIFWANLNYLNKINDKEKIKAIESQMLEFLKTNKNRDLFLCSVALDLNSNELIKADTKKILKDLCLAKQFLQKEQLENYWEPDTGFLSTLVKPYITSTDQIKNPKFKDWQEYTLFGRGFSDYLTIPMELTSKYQLTKDIKNLELAEQYFDSIKDHFDGGLLFGGEDRCLAVLSFLNLYSLKSETKYLDFGENLYNEIKTGQYPDANYQGPVCAWYYKDMYQLTEDKKYLDQSYKLIDIWSEFYFDDTQSKNKKDGNGGFFSLDGYFESKNILQNSLIVKSLIL